MWPLSIDSRANGHPWTHSSSTADDRAGSASPTGSAAYPWSDSEHIVASIELSFTHRRCSWHHEPGEPERAPFPYGVEYALNFLLSFSLYFFHLATTRVTSSAEPRCVAVRKLGVVYSPGSEEAVFQQRIEGKCFLSCHHLTLTVFRNIRSLASSLLCRCVVRSRRVRDVR